jgi:hypothetical protein
MAGGTPRGRGALSHPRPISTYLLTLCTVHRVLSSVLDALCVMLVLTVNKLQHDRDLRTHNQRAMYHHQENADALINLPMGPMSFHKPSEKVLLLLCLRPPTLWTCNARCRTMNYAAVSVWCAQLDRILRIASFTEVSYTCLYANLWLC